MATTTPVATTPIYSSKNAPKLAYAPMDEYLKKQRESMAGTTVGQATGFFKSQATGAPSSALQAAIAANREAMARQAATMRTQAGTTLAKGGALGQGTAVRGTQETERNILQTMADSRSKELQAIGEQQTEANKILLDQGNAEKSSMLSAIQAGLNSTNPAQQAASQRAMAQYLEANGIQQGTEESVAALNDFAANAAENDPLALAQKIEAEQTLAKARANAITAGTGTMGEKLRELYSSGSGQAAYDEYIRNVGPAPSQRDTDFWNKAVVPMLRAGQDPSQAIARWRSLRRGPNMSNFGGSNA